MALQRVYNQRAKSSEENIVFITSGHTAYLRIPRLIADDMKEFDYWSIFLDTEDKNKIVLKGQNHTAGAYKLRKNMNIIYCATLMSQFIHGDSFWAQDIRRSLGGTGIEKITLTKLENGQ